MTASGTKTPASTAYSDEDGKLARTGHGDQIRPERAVVTTIAVAATFNQFLALEKSIQTLIQVALISSIRSFLC